MNMKSKTMLQVCGWQESLVAVNHKPLTWLGQHCKRSLVGARGFEPPTSCTPCKRASRAAPRPEVSILLAGQYYSRV